LKDSSTPQVPESGNKVEGIAEWMINQCEIDPENARRYAAALVDIGCDRLKDLVEIDQEDWPIQVKKIHLKKILKALSLNLHMRARPLSGVSTGFSANSSYRGLDGGPYQPSGSKSPKRYFPFSTRSGYPEPAAGNVRDPSQFFDDVPLGLHPRPAQHNSPMRGLGGTFGRRPMAGNMSHETLERNPYAFAGSDSLDNTGMSLVQPQHNRWRYQPTSREHGHMSSMYARVQMPERGSLVHSGFSLDTSYSPLRRQRDRTPGHSDRELADLVYAGTQVSERSRRFTLLDWR